MELFLQMEPRGKPVWETDRTEAPWVRGALSPRRGSAGPARLPAPEQDLKTALRRTRGVGSAQSIWIQVDCFLSERGGCPSLTRSPAERAGYHRGQAISSHSPPPCLYRSAVGFLNPASSRARLWVPLSFSGWFCRWRAGPWPREGRRGGSAPWVSAGRRDVAESVMGRCF